MTRRAKPARWTMPEWMEPWRPMLADYGLGIEDLMNDHDSTFFNNEYRAAVIVAMKDQIGLLTRLYQAGKLVGASEPNRRAASAKRRSPAAAQESRR